MVEKNYAQEIPNRMGICCVNYRNNNMYSYDRFDVMELAEYIFDQIEKDQVELREKQFASSSGLYVTKKNIETYINDYLHYMEFKRSF